jgi:hypothetical protein
MHSKSFIQIGVPRSSERAFDGAAISAYSQGPALHLWTPQSLICEQGDNDLRDTSHSNLTHTGRGPTLAMVGHGEEEEDQQVAKSGIDFYSFIGFFVIVQNLGEPGPVVTSFAKHPGYGHPFISDEKFHVTVNPLFHQ